MKIQAPFWAESKELKHLFSLLDDRVRFVGGCVRDTLLGATPNDTDLATPLLPAEVKERLEPHFRIIPTGIEHGTLTVLINGKDLKKAEITTLRKDIATDGRHAVVAFSKDWKEDASRRDLTINALYADFQGNVFDFFGGIDDLKAGIVRFIGDPSARIREDYLRVLRFFRFYSRYAKRPPDKETLKACREGIEGVKKLSTDRLRGEFFALVSSNRAASGLKTAVDCGYSEFFFPVSPNTDALERFTQYCPSASVMWRFSALLPFEAIARNEFSKRWKLSKKDAGFLLKTGKEDVYSSCAAFSENGLLRFKERFEKDAETAAFLAAAVTDDVRWLSVGEKIKDIKIPPFCFSGSDIIAAGVTGRRAGEILACVKEYWLSKDARPNRQELLSFMATLI